MDKNGYELIRESLLPFSGTEVAVNQLPDYECVIHPEVEEGEETRFITVITPWQHNAPMFGAHMILNALSIAGLMDLDGELKKGNMSPVLEVLGINDNEITFEDMNFPLHGDTVII